MDHLALFHTYIVSRESKVHYMAKSKWIPDHHVLLEHPILELICSVANLLGRLPTRF